MQNFNTRAWYWLNAAGLQVYSSARGAMVSVADSTYREWLAQGYLPTPWPKDETGAQSTIALDDVLLATGLPATGLTLPTVAELIAYAEQKQNDVLSKGITVNVNAGVTGASSLLVLCDGTTTTRADLSMLRTWGIANPMSTRMWKDNNRVITTITGEQVVALEMMISTWVENVYTVENTIEASVNAGAITVFEQIDAALWPTS